MERTSSSTALGYNVKMFLWIIFSRLSFLYLETILPYRLCHILEYKFMLNSKSNSSVLWYNQMEKNKWIKFTEYMFKLIKIGNLMDFR